MYKFLLEYPYLAILLVIAITLIVCYLFWVIQSDEEKYPIVEVRWNGSTRTDASRLMQSEKFQEQLRGFDKLQHDIEEQGGVVYAYPPPDQKK